MGERAPGASAAVGAGRRVWPSALGVLATSLAAVAGVVLAQTPTLAASTTRVKLPAPANAQSAPTRTLPGVGNVDAAYCTTSCHQAIGAEWNASLHRNAWNDPVFSKAYELEPVAFCRGCHAPEGNPQSHPSSAAQADGVSCTTCHVEDGHVQGVGQTASRSSGAKSPHAFRKVAALGSEGACVSCHQFDFPAQAHQLSPSPMQDTIAEWRASSLASVSCQDCHMRPVGEGDERHKSHQFRVIGDAALLREAVVAKATRAPEGRVSIELSAGRVGHAFPTGDMFRRLQIRAFAVDPHGRVVAEAVPIELARVFRDVPRDPDALDKGDLAHQRIEVRDTRLAPPGTRGSTKTAELRVRDAGSHPIRWEVAYQRMMHPLAESFGVNTLEDEVLLASGVLDAPTLPTGPVSSAAGVPPRPR
jgi:hypothetical protein